MTETERQLKKADRRVAILEMRSTTVKLEVKLLRSEIKKEDD